MGDIQNEQVGREARAAVGAQRPDTGENRTQAAMRRYLGEVLPHHRTRHAREKPDVEGLARRGLCRPGREPMAVVRAASAAR